MKRFQFKFASVLKIRKTREEGALRALADAQRVYQTELSRKSRLVADLEQSLERRESLGIEPIAITSFKLETDFITGTKQRIIQQDQAILRASRGVEKALRSYLMARRQTKMMETLYDKAYAEYRRDRAKKDQKELDELSTLRARFAADSPFSGEASA